MRTFAVTSFLFSLVRYVHAVGVVGAAEGFAKGVTGGGSATPVYPSTTAQLVSYLGDSSPRVIVLQKTFDFTGSEGTTSNTGCAPWGTGSNCQYALNTGGYSGYCDTVESAVPKTSVSYDNAGVRGIKVASNKSLIGVGSSGIIKGKGLNINGATNVIVQNVHVTNINPRYVWGGDGITMTNTDLIWLDHIKTSLVGRMQIVLGTGSNARVTISNSELDGAGTYSTSCDSYAYWGILFDGSGDRVTLKGNYIHHFQGRSPSLDGNTLLHAVNNYFYDCTGHTFEVNTSGGTGVAEGNVFLNVKTPLLAGGVGSLYTATSNTGVCSTYLGHACQPNKLVSSGSFGSIGSTGFLSGFSGYSVASAATADAATVSVPQNAGIGKI